MAGPPPFTFVVGCNRSGTTLVRAMLDAHPAMTVVHESRFIVSLAAGRSRYERPGGFDAVAFTEDLVAHPSFARLQLEPADVAEALRPVPPADYPDAVRRVFATYAARRGKSRYADKTPEYVLQLPLLAALFPEARFVHVVRDGRDVAVALGAVKFSPRPVSEAALIWRTLAGQGRRDAAALGPDRAVELRYESLVNDPEPELRRLVAFLDLSYDDAMLRYFEQADEIISTAGFRELHDNIRRPPTAGLRDWRIDMAPGDVALFEALAGDLLDELGYERAVPRPDAGTRLRALRHRLEWRRSPVGRDTRRQARPVAS